MGSFRLELTGWHFTKNAEGFLFWAGLGRGDLFLLGSNFSNLGF